MQKQKKVRLPLLILAVPVILLYLLFALQPPDDYSDPAPNAIWSETIAGYGTGTPYNMINTSGKVAKRTSERYFYFAKGGERPGIYRKTRLGRAKRITYDDASYLNLYAQEEDSATEWIYYIRDGHTLCRVKVDGTVKEVLSNDCAFIFLRDRTLYFTNTDNELRSVGLSHIDQMDVQSRLIAQAASPKFCYNNFQIYFPYASDSSKAPSLAFFHLYENKLHVFLNDIPSSWNADNSYQVYYTNGADLYTYDTSMYGVSKDVETPSLLFTGDIAPDSRIYPTKTLLFVEGARTPGEKTFPLHRLKYQGGTTCTPMNDLGLDNIPCELYFFEGVFVQYDTQEGDIHATFSF